MRAGSESAQVPGQSQSRPHGDSRSWRAGKMRYLSGFRFYRHLPQPCIESVWTPDQIGMGAVLGYATVLEHYDPVALAHGREPMGDDDDSPPLHDLLHIRLDDPLALIIK